jgi:hypothetical protein
VTIQTPSKSDAAPSSYTLATIKDGKIWKQGFEKVRA